MASQPPDTHRQYEEGVAAGQTVSKHNSIVGGYEVGLMKGKEISQEIGFYCGFLDIIMRKITEDGIKSVTTAKITEKKFEMIHKLHETVQELCYHPEKIELGEKFFTSDLEKIHNKFKQAMSLLKLNVSYNSADQGTM